MEDITSELNHLPQSSQVILQWIPSHCGTAGNEIADTLYKTSLQSSNGQHRDQDHHLQKGRLDWKHKLQINNRQTQSYYLDKLKQ